MNGCTKKQKEEETVSRVLKHTVSWSFILNVRVSCGKWGLDNNAARYFGSAPGEETSCSVVIMFVVDNEIDIAESLELSH